MSADPAIKENSRAAKALRLLNAAVACSDALKPDDSSHHETVACFLFGFLVCS